MKLTIKTELILGFSVMLAMLADQLNRIAAASAEQNTGASQVNKAIQQLDQVIPQNSSASEEMASTVEELTSQAQQLQASVAFFKVGTDRRAEPRRPKFAGHPTRSLGVRPRKPVDGEAAETPTPASVGKAAKAIVLVGASADASDREFERY